MKGGTCGKRKGERGGKRRRGRCGEKRGGRVGDRREGSGATVRLLTCIASVLKQHSNDCGQLIIGCLNTWSHCVSVENYGVEIWNMVWKNTLW